MVPDYRGRVGLPIIVVDTCVLTRLLGDYSKVLQCILSNDDVIAISNECLNEYEGRAYASPLILQSFLQDLDGRKKLKKVGKSFVEARMNRLENHKTIAYPEHSRDKKWVKLAVAIEAHYILSINDHILKLPPNPCNNHTVVAIDPFDYVRTRCPDIPLNS